MFEQIKKTFDKGVELAFSTKDKIQQSVLEIAKENNLTKEEAKKLLDQVMKKSEEIKGNLEVKITELQKAAIEKMNLVSKKELTTLEERIVKLEKQLNIHSKSKTPSKLPVKVIRKRTIKKTK
jgi:polyhydroxyalkanoate synthesis regulator phasin